MFKILLIEDDATLFHEIKDRLTGWSFEVNGIQDFSNVLKEFTAVGRFSCSYCGPNRIRTFKTGS